MNYRKYSDYLSTLSEEELETIEFDDYFSFILNEDCIVQIGNYLYKVNTSTEKVYVMHEEFIEDYDYLVAENLENGHIQEYSTDDDVIYNVEGWDTPDKSCGGIGGGTYLAYGTKISDGLVIGYIGQYPVFLNPWVNMFRAGVYFRLSANFRLESPHPYLKEKGINIQVQVKGPQGGWCKRRPCCGSCEYTLSAEQIIINADENTISSSYTFYSGSRNLNGYYFFIRARNATAQPPYNQWTSYAGRNINSPY
jgi:hypothetical protein